MNPEARERIINNFISNFIGTNEGIRDDLATPNRAWLKANVLFYNEYWVNVPINTALDTRHWMELTLMEGIIEGKITEDDHKYFHSFAKTLNINESILPTNQRREALEFLYSILNTITGQS